MRYWNSASVVAVVGLDVPFIEMDKFFELSWNIVAKPKIYLNEHSVYVFWFQSVEDMNLILGKGP